MKHPKQSVEQNKNCTIIHLNTSYAWNVMKKWFKLQQILLKTISLHLTPYKWHKLEKKIDITKPGLSTS